MLVTVLLRISRSMNIIFFSVCEKLAARCVDIYVLPAPGPNEQNVITFISSAFTRMKFMLVRIMRKASEVISRPLICDNIFSL